MITLIIQQLYQTQSALFQNLGIDSQLPAGEHTEQD